MSQDAALQFVEALRRSADLQTQLQGLNLNQEANQSMLLETAAKAGYTFTFDEWTAVIERVADCVEEASASAIELSEQELEAVAGGVIPGERLICYIQDGRIICVLK